MRKTFRESELSSKMNGGISVTGGAQGVTNVLLHRKLKAIGFALDSLCVLKVCDSKILWLDSI